MTAILKSTASAQLELISQVSQISQTVQELLQCITSGDCDNSKHFVIYSQAHLDNFSGIAASG